MQIEFIIRRIMRRPHLSLIWEATTTPMAYVMSGNELR